MRLTYVHDPDFVWEAWYGDDVLLGEGPDVSARALACALAATDTRVESFAEITVDLSAIFFGAPSSLADLLAKAEEMPDG